MTVENDRTFHDGGFHGENPLGFVVQIKGGDPPKIANT
jgi:hypothetical protein